MQDYNQKFSGWREQLAMLTESLPGWIETAATNLTIFLLWFGFSQLSVIRNGLSLWRGGDLQVIPRPQVPSDAQPGEGQYSPAA